MAYFEDFPSMNFLKNDGSIQRVKDVLRRVVFTDESIFNESNYQKYNVKDGETPDLLAQKFYDDPELGWALVLYNNTIDPMYDFPLSRRSLNEFIEKKYGGESFFVESSTGEFPYFGDVTVSPGDKVSTAYNFVVEDKYGRSGSALVRSIEKFNDKTVSAQVKHVDHSLSKVEVVDIVGSFGVGDVLARRKTTTDTYRANIVKKINSADALHHFENDGVVLNPLGTSPDNNNFQYALGTTGADGSIVTIDQTLIYNYVNNDINSYVITNSNYEFKLNESKRQIRVPRPELMAVVSSEVKRLIQK